MHRYVNPYESLSTYREGREHHGHVGRCLGAPAAAPQRQHRVCHNKKYTQIYTFNYKAWKGACIWGYVYNIYNYILHIQLLYIYIYMTRWSSIGPHAEREHEAWAFHRSYTPP